MYASLYDLHSQGEVLSEEEEEHDEQHRYRQSTPIGFQNNKPKPMIESLLQQLASTGEPSSTSDHPRTAAKTYTPHIPHPTSVARTSQAYNRDHTPDSESLASKRTIKVVVDKISSDTKQAWLKWI